MVNNHYHKDWILDLGCAYHMTPCKDWFSMYKTVDNGVVYMGNVQMCRVARIDMVKENWLM